MHPPKKIRNIHNRIASQPQPLTTTSPTNKLPPLSFKSYPTEIPFHPSIHHFYISILLSIIHYSINVFKQPNSSQNVFHNLHKLLPTTRTQIAIAVRIPIEAYETGIVCSGAEDKSKVTADGNNGSLKALSQRSRCLRSWSRPRACAPRMADISGLTPCKESKQFCKREKQQLKKLESSLKLYAPGQRSCAAIKATMEKTKRRFDNYGKQGLLCGSDGLPHLIVSGDQRHWGEFITPGILFLYIAGWIGWVGRSYLIAIRDEKKPTQKEIIIDVPLASRLVFRGFSWPVAAYREFLNGELIDPMV
ncbi:hypothetical protein OSB04_009076 [Centaurea solstitialis]|uniref:Photosystem I reaction center subunit III n=1 Tax=Centaurea solstitialis TaxID=347529 RepID=A0AA38WU81_9ASTR|nr:hypothetical protein OSB04_009076 [Centaurea solstitialis]